MLYYFIATVTDSREKNYKNFRLELFRLPVIKIVLKSNKNFRDE